MRETDYVTKDDLQHVLALLMPQNRLICRVALQTGLRISDVLQLKTEDLAQRMTVHESKTGKSRRVYLGADLLQEVQQQAGRVWAFTGQPMSKTGHKTRQAVWKDIKRARVALRLKETVAPHSLRKFYAVEQLKKTGDLKRVQKLLQHTDPAITMLYAMADSLTQARAAQREAAKKKRQKKKG